MYKIYHFSKEMRGKYKKNGKTIQIFLVKTLLFGTYFAHFAKFRLKTLTFCHRFKPDGTFFPRWKDCPHLNKVVKRLKKHAHRKWFFCNIFLSACTLDIFSLRSAFRFIIRTPIPSLLYIYT